MKERINGISGEKEAEAKVSVVTMQVVTKGFSPYFTLVGHAQTVNKSDEFGEFVVKSCALEPYKVVNTVLLNH